MDPSLSSSVSRLFFPRIHRRINFSYLSRRRRSIGQLITRDHWIINATAGLFSKRSTRTLGGLRLGIVRLYIYARFEQKIRAWIFFTYIYLYMPRKICNYSVFECIANLDETFESIEIRVLDESLVWFLVRVVEEKKATKVEMEILYRILWVMRRILKLTV